MWCLDIYILLFIVIIVYFDVKNCSSPTADCARGRKCMYSFYIESLNGVFKEQWIIHCAACSISSVAEIIRDRALSLSREVKIIRWLPVVFLTNGASIRTHAGFELTTPVL